MSDEIIVLKDVCYKYEESSHNAVDHVSMTVRRGEMTAVLGRNGSGMSTLVKLINGLILPDSGTVLTDGMDTQDDEHVWDIRQRAGMVFQNPDNQLVATVVREDVAFGLENTGVPSTDMPERIDAALKAVNMTDFAERAPHLLSGGQKQRVAIAGILAMRPDIMLFDEATAMLDPRGRKEVFETVRQLNREGMTVVWITHFMEESAQCETVHIMHDGGLVLSGTPQEVFSDRERLQNWRLDVPPMAALAQHLRAAGVGLPEGILSIDDMTREVEALAAHL